jgi:thiol-disulfide isomerase/thioredoxin
MKYQTAKKTSYKYLYVALGIVGAALLGWGLLTLNQQSTKLDGFASCVAEKGATFYGAFWCPHCQAQKALFKRSSRLLPYVECSQPDGKTQTQACIDKGVKSYPTWHFADGSEQTGTMSLAQLAEKTGCTVPEDY